MSQFAIGWVSFVLPVRQARRFAAWADNKARPQERAGAYIAIIAMGGFLVGSLLQMPLDRTAACKASGATIIKCLVSPRPDRG